MTARITEEMRDVTADVMSAVKDSMDPSERAKAIDARIAELTKRRRSDCRASAIGSLRDAAPGKSYVMFISTVLRDVRLAYVPPRSIGEFGGEDDNWVWPRHTGDFSFLRAYVGARRQAGGARAGQRALPPEALPSRCNPAGVDEKDFVFILGYPGRTYRHQTSYYIAYEQNLRMPSSPTSTTGRSRRWRSWVAGTGRSRSSSTRASRGWPTR